jgi:hypothetical protein
MADKAEDTVGPKRYGWWSQGDFSVRRRVLVYYKKRTDAQIEAGIPPVEVRVTGVTSDKGGYGYYWKDKVELGELELGFLYEELAIGPQAEEALKL